MANTHGMFSERISPELLLSFKVAWSVSANFGKERYAVAVSRIAYNTWHGLARLGNHGTTAFNFRALLTCLGRSALSTEPDTPRPLSQEIGERPGVNSREQL